MIFLAPILSCQSRLHNLLLHGLSLNVSLLAAMFVQLSFSELSPVLQFDLLCSTLFGTCTGELRRKNGMRET